jgi:hypothetical protein
VFLTQFFGCLGYLFLFNSPIPILLLSSSCRAFFPIPLAAFFSDNAKVYQYIDPHIPGLSRRINIPPSPFCQCAIVTSFFGFWPLPSSCLLILFPLFMMRHGFLVYNMSGCTFILPGFVALCTDYMVAVLSYVPIQSCTGADVHTYSPARCFIGRFFYHRRPSCAPSIRH